MFQWLVLSLEAAAVWSSLFLGLFLVQHQTYNQQPWAWICTWIGIFSNLQVTFYKILPLKALSRTWGKINDFELPVFLRIPLLKLYVRYEKKQVYFYQPRSALILVSLDIFVNESNLVGFIHRGKATQVGFMKATQLGFGFAKATWVAFTNWVKFIYHS